MILLMIVLLSGIVAAVFYGVMLYNQLVSVKHRVEKAWANIDVLLKQRHDEIPKLVEVCKQYRQFEQDIMQKVMDARSGVYSASQAQDMDALSTAESALRGSMGRLFAVAEAYPELKANNSYVLLQTRISGLESSIADRRELFNETVNINNIRIEQFPASLIAGAYQFRERKLLEFSEEEKTDHDIKTLFTD